eukprot:Hpha_TRINITY_DN17797_c0_g1::TRINITY_DN17797_c0_g1_i1::g.46292::m.46292
MAQEGDIDKALGEVAVAGSELLRSRETKTRGPYEYVYYAIYGEYPRAACWGIRELFIQCVLASNCVKEQREFKPCIKTPECVSEAMGLTQCRVMSFSPKRNLRGNRWDSRTEDELRAMIKEEKIKQRERELGEQVDETHEVYQKYYQGDPSKKSSAYQGPVPPF